MVVPPVFTCEAFSCKGQGCSGTSACRVCARVAELGNNGSMVLERNVVIPPVVIYLLEAHALEEQARSDLLDAELDQIQRYETLLIAEYKIFANADDFDHCDHIVLRIDDLRNRRVALITANGTSKSDAEDAALSTMLPLIRASFLVDPQTSASDEDALTFGQVPAPPPLSAVGEGSSATGTASAEAPSVASDEDALTFGQVPAPPPPSAARFRSQGGAGVVAPAEQSSLLGAASGCITRAAVQGLILGQEGKEMEEIEETDTDDDSDSSVGGQQPESRASYGVVAEGGQSLRRRVRPRRQTAKCLEAPTDQRPQGI